MKITYDGIKQIDLVPGDLVKYMLVNGTIHRGTFIGVDSYEREGVVVRRYIQVLTEGGIVKHGVHLIFKLEKL
jgi:hypothetical protein